MNCTNPIKCSGEMKPLPGWPKFTECNKCGYRIDTPKVATGNVVKAAEAPTPVVNKQETTTPKLDKVN